MTFDETRIVGGESAVAAEIRMHPAVENDGVFTAPEEIDPVRVRGAGRDVKNKGLLSPAAVAFKVVIARAAVERVDPEAGDNYIVAFAAIEVAAPIRSAS